MPTGSKSDWIIEKATELGARYIVPLITGYSTFIPKSEHRHERWERLIQQASKQSLCPIVPTLQHPLHFEQMIEQIHSKEYDMKLWGCVPNDLQFPSKTITSLQPPTPLKSALLLVGPEGDFSLSEKQTLMKEGGIPVCLSHNRLRVETASILFVGLVMAHWNLK